MLYERWREIAAGRRNETALHEAATGRRWTFGQLFLEGEHLRGAASCRFIAPPGHRDAEGRGGRQVVFPSGHAPEFIFQLLAAWRDNKIACPLEPGHETPLISSAPEGCVQFKRTSATAGAPRLVSFDAEQLAADADQIVKTMGLRQDWPNLAVISLPHSYGFSNLVLPLLLHGIPLLLAPSPLPEAVRRAAEMAMAVTIPAVPAMWRAWHQAGAIPANVALAISAGAPMPLNLERDIFDATGLKVHNFLGASECGGMAYDASAVPRDDAALAGAPMQNADLSVGDDGCLLVRGPAVGQTYWPEASPALADGCFHSRDLAELRDGRVFLRGRLDDLINVAGRKVSPQTIENELLANPKVSECLVLGVPDLDRTETIAAIVVSDAGESELRKFLSDKLPAWQVPREWRFVESLSVNARGKISRVEWRKRLQPAERG